ncbi:MAG: adenine phosphoribosyltransferase [bacterium]|nr:adenine phosphoribosyltransferase [bacterium]
MLDLKDFIRDIPDFPKEGILFKDITPLWQDPAAFRQAIDTLIDRFKDERVEIIIGAEARGFIIGAPMAYQLGTGLIPVRKPGKLPYKTISASYDLEYGTDSLEMHVDAVSPGQRVLIVDDLLATGGTAKALVELVEKAGAKVIGIAFLVELTFLYGRDKLEGYEVFSLMQY